MKMLEFSFVFRRFDTGVSGLVRPGHAVNNGEFKRSVARAHLLTGG